MPNAEEEAAWRAEFEAAGETEVRDRLYSNMYPGEKNSAAFRWLRQQAPDMAAGAIEVEPMRCDDLVRRPPQLQGF
jgi:hypothetical protein